jgi:hypothetical protein
MPASRLQRILMRVMRDGPGPDRSGQHPGRDGRLLPVVRVVREAATTVEIDPGRQLSAVRDGGDAGRSEMTESVTARAMKYDGAVRRWVAATYRLDPAEIDDVTFDVQYSGESPTLDPSLQLEIEVSLNDCTRYLFVRDVSDFGRIINEILEFAS